MPALTNTQENQRRGATTAGESFEDTSFEKNDTDTTEALKPIPPTIKTQSASDHVQRGVVNQVLFTCKVAEETYRCKVEERSEGNYELDELDYIDLSQLPSFPSTPLVQQEDIISISHIGTLVKGPHSPTTNLHRGNDKRVKIEDCSSSDLSALHAPDSSRVSALPLICFYYYHKGYCNPKGGRRCDYLHDTSTAQQTVSLPNGIIHKNPACALPLCLVRLRGLPGSPTALTQLEFESEPDTAPVDDASLHEQRTDKEGKKKRKKRGAKKSAREKKRLQMEKQETIERELKETSNALVEQRPLSLFASEQTPGSASLLSTSTLAEEQNTNHGVRAVSEGAHQRPQEDQHVPGVEAVEHRPPEGSRGLDCNINLIRRFFDEFG